MLARFQSSSAVACIAPLITFVGVGCSRTTFSAHAYPPPERPTAELAEVSVKPNVRLVQVDGKRVDALPVDLVMSKNPDDAERNLFLLPGRHRVLAGIAAAVEDHGSPGFGAGGMTGSGVGFGIGFTPGGGGAKLDTGSTVDHEIQFNVEAGKTYTLLMTRSLGAQEADTRLVIKDRALNNQPAMMTFVRKVPHEDPYGIRATPAINATPKH